MAREREDIEGKKRHRRVMVTFYPRDCDCDRDSFDNHKSPAALACMRNHLFELQMALFDPDATAYYRYFISGMERGEEEAHCHLQTYFVHESKDGWSNVRWVKHFWQHAGDLIHGLKVIPCDGDDKECVNYCRKDYDGGFGEYVEYGTRLRNPGAREKEDWVDYRELAKAGNFDALPAKIYVSRATAIHAIHRVASQRPPTAAKALACDPSEANVWLWGPPGTGKSWEARELFPAAAGGFQPIYVKGWSKWWCNYRWEPVVLIDDIQDPSTWKSSDDRVDLLKAWADRYPFPAENKGGSTAALIRPKHIVVTSNYAPSQIADEQLRDAILRRFTVRQIGGDGGEEPYIRRRATELLVAGVVEQEVIDLSQDD